MKTFKLLLVTALWITLFTGFYSCGKDDFEAQEPEGTIMPTIYDDYINYKDYECLGGISPYKEEKALISGLKDKHLWFGVFEYGGSKAKLYEWTDPETTNRKQNLYIGYGEYKELSLYSIGLYELEEVATSGFISRSLLLYGEKLENCKGKWMFIFKSPNNIKKIYSDWVTNTKFESMRQWYKSSWVIDNCCYDSEGDTIFIPKIIPKANDNPVSYKEGIYIDGQSIIRINYEDNKIIWQSKVTPPFQIVSNCRYSFTLQDSSTLNWKYKADITYYDGTKKDFTFAINIENGEITVDGVQVTGINLNNSTIELNQTETFQLVATVQPNNATNKNVTWKSSNESIAKVNDKGLVTAMSEGTTTITATTEDGHFTAQTVVKVLSSKRIVSIKSEDYNISFVYSNDKLNSFIWKYTNGDYDFNQTIAYSDAKVIISGEADGNKCIQTYLLNKYGHATSCSISDYNGKSIDISFEYSEKGYLTKAIEITKYNSETRSNTYSFTYSDNGDILNGKESHTSGNIYTQSYGSVRNKSGIMDYAMSQLLFNYQAAFYCGILGKSCMHLPSSCKKTEVYEMGWSRTYDFIYTQDDSGYVTKTIIADSEGKAETLNYTYE